MLGLVKFSVHVRLVSDLERSRRYYREVLGCDVNDFWAVRDDFRLGFKLLQAERDEDVRPNPRAAHHAVSWDTYAYVETHPELDELYEELRGKGAAFAQEPTLTEADWGTWKEFAVKDPDGYVVAFGSGKKK
ncbi:VOC family protein [Cohnella thermotolerans]|uniref:VOC family protein n=1 Tax=Cohnella thermotolerans TaxID=329858 RepID=UPI000427E9B2|nr:VOC family protein [Cohnella thermotolerans]